MSELDHEQRSLIRVTLRRNGFVAAEYIPATMQPQFEEVIIAARFAPGLSSAAIHIMEDEVSKIIGKPVMLRDKRLTHRDKILQVANLETL